MAEEPVVIEATAGPYAGQRLTVAAADAKQAIADGWAKDPFAAAEEAKEVKEMTDEDRAKVAEAAEKAAKKLRGENDDTEKKPAKGKTADEDKSLEADKPASSYETRSTSSTLPKSK